MSDTRTRKELLEEIDRLSTRVGELQMWLCPHRKRMQHDADDPEQGFQCAECAGIIYYDPEEIAIRRAERAEAVVRDLVEGGSREGDWNSARRLVIDLNRAEEETNR